MLGEKRKRKEGRRKEGRNLRNLAEVKKERAGGFSARSGTTKIEA